MSKHPQWADRHAIERLRSLVESPRHGASSDVVIPHAQAARFVVLFDQAFPKASAWKTKLNAEERAQVIGAWVKSGKLTNEAAAELLKE